MRCTNPLFAVRLYKPAIGKQVIKILPKRVDFSIEEMCQRYGENNLLQLPCGHCPACLSRKSKEWAVRCCLESKQWKDNCFVTLTYDEKNYPGIGKKEDLQDFIKSIRNCGYKIRYFACCERGETFGRYHYHMIIFNYFPMDAKPWMKSDSGYMQYTSKFLTSIWNKGLVTIAEFHPFAAQYVAGYVVKKLITGDKDQWHIQSTRPGIGAAYFFKNCQNIYDTDNLVLTFGSHRFSVPRYFDKLAEQLDIDLTDIKEARLEKAKISRNKDMQSLGFDCEDRLLIHNEEFMNRNIKAKKRRF